MDETHLEQAERHVAENQKRIERQRELIRELEREGHFALLPEANQLLQDFEEF